MIKAQNAREESSDFLVKPASLTPIQGNVLFKVSFDILNIANAVELAIDIASFMDSIFFSILLKLWNKIETDSAH